MNFSFAIKLGEQIAELVENSNHRDQLDTIEMALWFADRIIASDYEKRKAISPPAS